LFKKEEEFADPPVSKHIDNSNQIKPLEEPKVIEVKPFDHYEHCPACGFKLKKSDKECPDCGLNLS